MRKFSGNVLCTRAPYRLVLMTWQLEAGRVEVLQFPSLEELAKGISRCRTFYRYAWAPVLRAFSPRGSTLPVLELAAYGTRLAAGERSVWGFNHRHAYRAGPVAGIRCERGGGGGYARTLHHTQATRRGSVTFKDEGEVPPRAARNFVNLPNSWREKIRCVERNWKSQHRGRKAWDRPQSHCSA